MAADTGRCARCVRSLHQNPDDANTRNPNTNQNRPASYLCSDCSSQLQGTRIAVEELRTIALNKNTLIADQASTSYEMRERNCASIGIPFGSVEEFRNIILAELLPNICKARTLTSAGKSRSADNGNGVTSGRNQQSQSVTSVNTGEVMTSRPETTACGQGQTDKRPSTSAGIRLRIISDAGRGQAVTNADNHKSSTVSSNQETSTGARRSPSDISGSNSDPSTQLTDQAIDHNCLGKGTRKSKTPQAEQNFSSGNYIMIKTEPGRPGNYESKWIPNPYVPETIRVAREKTERKKRLICHPVITLSDSEDSGNERGSTSASPVSTQSTSRQPSNWNTSQNLAGEGRHPNAVPFPHSEQSLSFGKNFTEMVNSQILGESTTASPTSTSSSSSLPSTWVNPRGQQSGKRQLPTPDIPTTESIGAGSKRKKKRWSDVECKEILNYMARSSKNNNLEKPSSDMYHTDMIRLLNLKDCTSSTLQMKVSNLRRNYNKALRTRERTWPTPTAKNIASMEALQEKLEKKFPLFPHCREVWGEDDMGLSHGQGDDDSDTS